MSPAEILQELEEMRTAGGHNMGLSALTHSVKALRENNAKTMLVQPAISTNVDSLLLVLPSELPSDPSVAGKKRKAASIDPRCRPKKVK